MNRTSGRGGGPGELLAHMAGDYLLQGHWMAVGKTTSWGPACAHAASYTACFLPVTRSWRALAVIGATHAVIDRYRLARQLVWLKNQAAPAPHRYPWAHGRTTGYHTFDHEMDDASCIMPPMPEWMAFWLMVLSDNAVHLLINRAALRVWGRRD